MELVVARTRKEAKILKNGEKFLSLVGLTIEDVIDFKHILIENRTLTEVNKKLLAENKALKGESNEQSPDSEVSVSNIFGHKEEIR